MTTQPDQVPDERLSALEELMRRDPGAAMMTIGLLLASADRNYETLRQIADTHQREAERLRATIDCIVERVTFLSSGTYMPTAMAIIRALSPAQDEIYKRITDNKEKPE